MTAPICENPISFYLAIDPEGKRLIIHQPSKRVAKLHILHKFRKNGVTIKIDFENKMRNRAKKGEVK
jgi:hypothetical protein